MTPPSIDAAAVSVRRGGRQVLDGVQWQVEPGTVCGVVGPSGSGKTTLLRVIIGAQRFSGEMTVLGRPAGAPELRHKIGYVTQSVSVYDDLTALENIRYFAQIVGVGATDVDRVVDAVGLTSRGSDLVGRLSGGQRSRVSLAVALLGRPELLVLDEPTVGQDPVLRLELWSLFARLAAQGTTLLVSSHAMDEAARCDTLLLLREGRVLSAGRSPAQLCEQTGADNVEGAFLALIGTSA